VGVATAAVGGAATVFGGVAGCWETSAAPTAMDVATPTDADEGAPAAGEDDEDAGVAVADDEFKGGGGVFEGVACWV